MTPMMAEKFEKYVKKLASIFEARNFNKAVTNMQFFSTPQEYEMMFKILEENPKMTEEEFLKEMGIPLID